jgi:hypothetical protein
MGCVTPNHEDRVGKAIGREAEKSDNDEEDLPQAERVDAD